MRGPRVPVAIGTVTSTLRAVEALPENVFAGYAMHRFAIAEPEARRHARTVLDRHRRDDVNLASVLQLLAEVDDLVAHEIRPAT